MSLIFAVLGLVLFAYFLWQAGIVEITERIRRLGAGFLLVVALGGVRSAVRALAWTLCFEAPYRLRFRDAFNAYLTGDALGNLVPLGMVVSEPAKAALVRHRVPLMAGLAAIAVEYLFYSLSVAVLIFLGAAALLLSFPLPQALQWASLGALAGVVVIALTGFIIIRRQWKFTSRALDRLHGRGIGRRVLGEHQRARISSVEDRIYGFYARNPWRFVPILLLEACFHLAGVVEVYVTLYFVSDAPPTLLTAFVLESVNRVINVVFKFVPFRVGVDEAGTGLLTKVLKLGTTSGVTLAIVRKARVLVWTAVGVALLASRGLSLRAVADDAAQAVGAGEPEATSDTALGVRAAPLEDTSAH